MATRTQNRRLSLSTEPVGDLTPRAVERRFREMRQEWREKDTHIYERIADSPGQFSYTHESALSRAKHDASYSKAWQVRRLFMDLARQQRWQEYELLALHFVEMFTEVRATATDETPLNELVRDAGRELTDILDVSVDALTDGVVDAAERERLARETSEGIAELRRLRRRCGVTGQ